MNKVIVLKKSYIIITPDKTIELAKSKVDLSMVMLAYNVQLDDIEYRECD